MEILSVLHMNPHVYLDRSVLVGRIGPELALPAGAGDQFDRSHLLALAGGIEGHAWKPRRR